MIYYLVRILFFAVLFFALLGYPIYRKRNLSKRTLYRSFWILVAACLISFHMPLEYLFVRYASIEEAFSYGHSPNSIIEVVQKDDIAVVVYTQDNKSISFYPLYKEKRGWKIDLIKTFYTPHKFYNFNFVYDFTFPKQSDAIIFIINSSFVYNSPKISDNQHSNFFPITYQLNNNEHLIYYAILPTMNENYSITINQDSFKLN